MPLFTGTGTGGVGSPEYYRVAVTSRGREGAAAAGSRSINRGGSVMSSTHQKVATIFGAIFVLAAFMGFFAGGFSMQASMLLGLFPVNLVHNLVHLVFGGWGLWAALNSDRAARSYCQISGLIYLALAGLGATYGDRLESFLPIHGNDIWLHALIGGVLTVFGFVGETITRRLAKAS